MKHTIMVIDLGTTNIKAALKDEAGETVSVKTLSTPVFYGENSMEIDPGQLWRGVLDCCRGAVSDAGGQAHVDAVVVSSMAASFIPLNSSGQVLCGAIGWGDARSTPYMEGCMEEFCDGRQIPNCGQYPLPMYAGFKLWWLRERRPEVFRAVSKWLNVSEWIYGKLTGEQEYVTDYSVASRTMLFDIDKRCWNPAALEYFEVNPEWLARPLPAGTVVGTAAVETWEAGLSPDTKIVLGGHDHMCAIAGAGITRPGIVLNSTGTSEAVECLTAGAKEPEKLAARWINLESAVLPGWAAAVYYVGASGRVYQSACETMREYRAGEYPMPEDGPVFLPPQRAQLPSVKGELRNISPVFDGQGITRALRDGMYFECRRGIQRILHGGDVSPDRVVRCVGGHTKNLFEMQLKSDAIGCTIEIAPGRDMVAEGAFLLAGVACGWYDAIPEAAERRYEQTEKRRFYPDLERSQRYEELYMTRYLPQFDGGVNGL